MVGWVDGWIVGWSLLRITDLTSTGMLLSHIKQPELTLLYQRVPSAVLLRHAEQ